MTKKVEIKEKEIEAPYELPEGWKWVRLGDAVEIHNGDRGENYPNKKDYVLNGIPFINAGCLIDGKIDYTVANYVTEEKYNSLRAGKIQKEDILYCLRGSLGKIGIVQNDEKGAISSSLCIFRSSNSIIPNFLLYILKSDVTYQQQKKIENGTAQPNLSAKEVSNYLLPLPPLAEQQRIVNRIESLFAKLDEAKEKAQNVVDSFETRKAAILHKAFTGELTANWRKENGVTDDSWEEKTIGEAMHLQAGKNISANKISKNMDNNNQYPCFGGNGIRGYVDTFNNEGSFPIIGRQGALCGNLNFATGKFYATEHAVVVTCPSTIDSTWAYYTLGTMNLNQYATATAQPGLAVSNIVKLNIPVPSLPEQQEIVRILDFLLDKESRAKEAAQTVLDQIALLKKSILARAFRGEL